MRNYLITMEHETFGRHQIEKAKVLHMFIHKMAYNSLNGTVFIADNSANIICEYNLTNEKAVQLVSSVGLVTSLAFGECENILKKSVGL